MQLIATGMWVTPFAGAAAVAGEFFPAEHERADSASFALAAAYTADLWRNSRGGLRTGGTYLDNLDITVSVDGERMWGVAGLSAYAHLLYNNNATFSERYVGDEMAVSNIDASGGTRLYEAWLEWLAGGERPLSFRFGLYDLNSEFDTSSSRSLFIHSTHGVGHELAQSGLNGPSIFPNTSLGLRASWRPTSNWRLLAAVLDGVPGDPENPTRTGIHLSREEGALGIAEAQWSSGRIDKLSIGHWRYSARFPDALSTDSAPLPDRRDNRGSYAAIDVELGPSGSDREGRASAFARIGVAEGRINAFDQFVSLGIRYKGGVAGRPEDEIGLAFSRARVGHATRRIAAASGVPQGSYEAAVELTWRSAINDWLTVQPDIQYIINPGADPDLADALAFGVRFEVSARFVN